MSRPDPVIGGAKRRYLTKLLTPPTLHPRSCLAQRGSVHRDPSALASSSPAFSSAHSPAKSRTVGGVTVTHQATVVIDEGEDEHELAEFAARSGAGGRKQAAYGAAPARMYMVRTEEDEEVDEKGGFAGINSV